MVLAGIFESLTAGKIRGARRSPTHLARLRYLISPEWDFFCRLSFILSKEA